MSSEGVLSLEDNDNGLSQFSQDTQNQSSQFSNIHMDEDDDNEDDDEDDMDIDLEPNDYRPGTLLKIKMVNFMCHDSFEINLGPRVNFVIGPNGSGKSAVLTALVVALGGRAALTSRAKKFEEFIKYGKTQARIEIHIHNFKYLAEKNTAAFKPDEYGHFIIIEKVIKVGESRTILRNEHKHIVSEKRSELDAICEHFRIQVHNPIVILNQEVSKSFLHSKRPEDKYTLYEEATLLNQIRRDYAESAEEISVWKETCLDKQKSYESVSREQEDCRNKILYIQESKKIHEQIDKLECELMWSVHKEKEKFETEISRKIEHVSQKVKDKNSEIERMTEKIEKHKNEISETQLELKATEEDRKGEQREVVNTRIRVNELRSNLRLIQGEISRYDREKSNLKRDGVEYEKKLQQLQSQMQQSQAGCDTIVDRQKKCEIIENELQNLKAREATRRTHLKHQEETCSHLRQEISSALGEKSNLQQKMKQVSTNLERLTSGKENSLRKFGEYMIDLCKEIDHCYSQKKFSQKPIGPLGSYIQLNNSNIALALETCLKNLSYAFICDNLKDMQTLTALFKRRFPGQRPPQMITRRFSNKRHDVSKTRVLCTDHACFLDLIEISNDQVFNIIIDKANLENILYIPNYEEAEELMIDPRLTPEHCRCAYTRDGCVMYPKTSESGYRSYANEGRRALIYDSNVDEHIKRLEDEKGELQELFRAAIQKSDSLNLRFNVAKKESDTASKSLDEVNREIRQKEEQLLELRHTVDENPAEMSIFQEELAKIKEKIQVLQEKINDKQLELEALTKEIKTFDDSCKKYQENEQKLVEKIVELEHQISDQQKSIDQKQRKLNSLQNEIEAMNKQKHQLQNEHEESVRLLAESSKELENIPEFTGEDESTEPRSVELVTRELNKAKKTIKAKESLHKDCFTDPVAAVERLENRIHEIDKIKNQMKLSVSNMKHLHQAVKERKVGYKELIRVTNRMLGLTFAAIMSGMNMQGDLNFYVDDVIDPETGKVVKKAKTLEILVNTKSVDSTQTQNTHKNGRSGTQQQNVADAQQHMSDTRSLSGGERSYSTVAFIIALWKHCHAPFKVLDEVDVFMDMVTRRISYNALIDFAVSQRERAAQYIFLSPLELPKINDPSLVKVKVMPQPVRDNAPADTNDT